MALMKPTDYTVQRATKRTSWYRWDTHALQSYREDQVVTITWLCTNDPVEIPLQDPLGLIAGGYNVENRENLLQHGDPQGVYQEIYTKEGAVVNV